MIATSKISLVTALALFAVAPGCGAPREPAAPETARTKAAPRPDRAIYRFDFVVRSDSAAPPTAFSIQLEEEDRGEVHIGRNVALAPPPAAGPRADVGLKLNVYFRTLGDDVLLDVLTERSTADATTVQKTVMKSQALLAPDKPALVAMVDDAEKRFELSVTPTRMR